VRRILAFNLSDIEGRLGHVEAMTAAWEEARGPDLDDSINLRLAQARVQRTREEPRLLDPPNGPPRDDAVLRATYGVAAEP
jgi:hypothetical protein